MIKEIVSPDGAFAGYHSGVVAIIGPPNAGKSTLVNHFLGQKITIVSPLPQTTRNRIMGIVTGESYQMIMLDTPGLHKPKELLNREMVRIAKESIGDADMVLLLTDTSVELNSKRARREREELTEYLSAVRCPVVLALNKIDLLSKEQVLPLIECYNQIHPFKAVLPISALKGEGTKELLEELIKLLPEGPQYYPDDIPTDATERFIVAETIREKIFLLTKEEIPYFSAVIVESFKEGKPGKPITIHATIMVERDSQKGIIIGKQGKMIKKIGTDARHDIEKLLDARVMLKLFVKVKKKWTKNQQILRELGM